MSHAVRLLLWLAFALLSIGIARADYQESKAWFNELSGDERTEIQSSLTLLGHYSYLIDGQFGTGTYEALLAFQKTRSTSASGVLTTGDREALSDKAAEVYRNFGMSLITDEGGQAKLIVPETLLSNKQPAEHGTSWTSPDGDIVLETSHIPAGEQSFKKLFLSLSTPSPKRKITYSSFNDERFVSVGEGEGRYFYSMYRNAGTESVGYTVTWTRAHDDEGTVISAYLASNFSPLNSAPLPVEEQKSSGATASLRSFGAFTLPSDEAVISLDGEIKGDTATQFLRALKARPDAKVLLLNSPGGYVDTALIIAREVHRRGMATVVERGDGCYSACSYIFFAGTPRFAEGELGVHQISAEVADLVLAQTTLSDVIDALDSYGVQQIVIVRMLRTPPEDMYVFTQTELKEWDINRGDPVRVADIDPQPGPATDPDPGPADPGKEAIVAFVELAQRSERSDAERSLQYAVDRWAGVLGDAEPTIEQADMGQGTVFRVRVPARSVESANAMCEAIKSAGGGCYVSQADR